MHFNGKTAENKFGSGNGDLIAIDALRIDDHSRMTLTKKLRKVFSVEIDDVLAIFQDKKNGDLRIKIQRGENVVDSWIMSRFDDNRENLDPQLVPAEGTATIDSQLNEGNKRFNIMLIDDEPDVLSSFKSMLRSEDYNTETFTSSGEALNNFIVRNGNAYNLIITDIRMPSINGIQLYLKLKKIDPRIRVLFCSALDAAEELVALIPEIEDRQILAKPIGRDKLLKTVKSMLM